MPELTDIPNEFIRAELDEFVEREDERTELIGLYAAGAPQLLEIAANWLTEGDTVPLSQIP